MNENVLNMNQRIESLESIITDIQQVVAALKINDQRRLNSNAPIPPGIATKLAYDANGLVLQGTKLEVSDIPSLPIEKIDNLKLQLDSKASIRDLDIFKKSVTEMIQPTIDELSIPTNTGIKVNYNKDGRIVSSSDLLPSDIPQLSIDKIDGLLDIIESFNSYLTNPITVDNIPDIKIIPASYIKVSVDQYGRVISGERKLSLNDIPNELLTRINVIESRLSNTALQHSVDTISKSLDTKLEANPLIKAGTYTKVKVDTNGLVLHGEKLSVNDLPTLNISDINNLDKVLKDKANQNDVLELNSTVSKLVNSLSNLGEIAGIKNELQHKASNEEVAMISNKVKGIQNILNTVLNNLPGDMLSEQLGQIQSELSSISGRISVIENHLNIK